MKDLEISGLTKQRRAVLRVIRDSDEHLAANEVFEHARTLLPGISFASVYNSLRYLRREGLIGEVRFGADCTRYDRTLKRHDHAICNCGGKLSTTVLLGLRFLGALLVGALIIVPAAIGRQLTHTLTAFLSTSAVASISSVAIGSLSFTTIHALRSER